MRVIREKSILEKINDEIRDNTKPDIVRIDLDENEFLDFMHELNGRHTVATGFNGNLKVLPEYSHLVGESNIRYTVGKFKGAFTFRGSYVFYKEVCVQCCYEEE